MAVVTLLARIYDEAMMHVAGSQRSIAAVDTPGASVMTNRTCRDVAGISVAVVAGEVRAASGQRVMLRLVALARRMTDLAAGVGLVLGRIGALGIDHDIVVTVGAGQAGRVLQHDVVTSGGFTLVTIVAVERPGCIGVAGGAVSCSRGRGMMSVSGALPLPVVCRVMTAFAVGDRGNSGVACLTIDAVGAGRRMVGIADTAVVTADAAGQRGHGGMAGGAVDRRGRIVCRGMVRRPDLALVTAEAVGQVADIGVALGAVAGRGGHGVMMAVLLGHEGVARGAVAVGGDALVALVAEPLAVEFRLVMPRCDVVAMALGTVARSHGSSRGGCCS